MSAADSHQIMAHLASLKTELGYAGPERRGGANAGLVQLLSCVLDEIDYGLILLGADGQVVHANHGAATELQTESSGLQVVAKRLQCREPTEQAALDGALEAAQKHGRRSMLQLRLGGSSALSIVPLPTALTRNTEGHAVLVTMQRSRIVESLTVSAYGRAHGLSRREEQVLGLMCDGLRAADIAAHLQVSQATVRSHVHNLKAKTGTSSVLELVKQVAVLPPMVATLNRSRGGAIR